MVATRQTPAQALVQMHKYYRDTVVTVVQRTPRTTTPHTTHHTTLQRVTITQRRNAPAATPEDIPIDAPGTLTATTQPPHTLYTTTTVTLTPRTFSTVAQIQQYITALQRRIHRNIEEAEVMLLLRHITQGRRYDIVAYIPHPTDTQTTANIQYTTYTPTA